MSPRKYGHSIYFFSYLKHPDSNLHLLCKILFYFVYILKLRFPKYKLKKGYSIIINKICSGSFCFFSYFLKKYIFLVKIVLDLLHAYSLSQSLFAFTFFIFCWNFCFFLSSNILKSINLYIYLSSFSSQHNH
jgi:hypothetical protein